MVAETKTFSTLKDNVDKCSSIVILLTQAFAYLDLFFKWIPIFNIVYEFSSIYYVTPIYNLFSSNKKLI